MVINHNALYNAALYLRLSKDDDLIGDSSSIQTQRLMLERYCKDNGYSIFDVYIDDGYSGTNFNRPNFIRMLDDIENKKVNMVITKDLSRLGRDYIQTGYYTEVYFISKNIRYIAINDGFDTKNPENDIAPFKNILNDMYAKDLSKKVKLAKKQRAMKGYFISPTAPYGYKKHPQDINRLVVDEAVADNVRLVFQLALEGNGCTRIAKELSRRRITIPSTYKSRNGETTFDRFGKDKDEEFHHKWCKMTVQTMMKDRVYVGDMVNNKFEVISYKSDKLRKVPQDKLIIVEKTHEPIVSREDFDTVQKLMKSRHSPRKYNHDNIFKSGDPVLYLYDDNMNYITENDDGNGSGNGGRDAKITYTLQAGKTYYFRIRGFSNSSGYGYFYCKY
jgi:DNA invertase Pin-like site-specific DNA recombinase